MKWNEYLAIVISVASVVSSGFYTYTYVNLQKTEFFNRIHSEYSTQDMQDAFDNLVLGICRNKELINIKQGMLGLERQEYFFSRFKFVADKIEERINV